MIKLIDGLREEHRNTRKLLLALEQELSVFDQGELPDYQVISGIIGYFNDYTESCHRPAEHMLLDALDARDPALARGAGDLKAQHRAEAKRLQRAADVVESVLMDREIPRQEFDQVLRDFIDHEREHMEMEERVLFPAAVEALQPDDWSAIEARVGAAMAVPSNVAVERRCRALRERVLQWEQENAEGRA